MSSESFTKLWSSILDSSVWGQPPEIKVVWITMLAMAERDGYVGASVDGLARRSGVSIEWAQKALESFLAPDPMSRSQDFDGRRIEVAPRGWRILNWDKFRNQRDMLAKREQDAERQRRLRARHAVSRDVTPSRQESPRIDHTEADTERETEVQNQTQHTPPAAARGESLRTKPATRPDDVTPETWDDWIAHRKRKRSPMTEGVIATTRTRAKAAGMTLEEALAYWTAQGTQGFYPPAQGTISGRGSRERPLSAQSHWGPLKFSEEDKKNGWG